MTPPRTGPDHCVHRQHLHPTTIDTTVWENE